MDLEDREELRPAQEPPEGEAPGTGEPETEEPEQEEEENGLVYNLYYWLQTLVVAVVSIVLVFTFIGRITRVDGTSMVDTLHDGDLLILQTLGCHPKQGDIVVLNKTSDKTYALLRGDPIVKRVIAVGGQTLEIDYASSTVYVDGEALDEPYITQAMLPKSGPYSGQTPVKVPEGELFVMGDNRNGSTDSRVEALGTVNEGYVMGRALCIVYPFNRIKLL